jgi:glycosyltransferase involved in cell wall biosynthesis
LRSYVFKSPLRVISTDDAPVIDPTNYPIHPVDLRKPAWRRSVRLGIDLWRVRRADLLVPFSKWASEIIIRGTGKSPDVVKPIHVGIDLEQWRYEPRQSAETNQRLRVLFVGADFTRKGGAHLLESFERHLADIAELHLVTKSAPTALPPNVYVYDDLNTNDARLANLYRRSDLLVHPTTSDLSPWVVLEAMASGLPTVVTPVGGIADLVEEGKTGFFVPVGDVDALAAAIRSLADNPQRRRQMGECARRFIEQNYDASVNVRKILELMKSVVDRRGAAPSPRGKDN